MGVEKEHAPPNFPKRTFFGTTKLKDFVTLSSFHFSQRRKLLRLALEK
jgi:hypothetical protein